jgi:hypothetical protein
MVPVEFICDIPETKTANCVDIKSVIMDIFRDAIVSHYCLNVIFFYFGREEKLISLLLSFFLILILLSLMAKTLKL